MLERLLSLPHHSLNFCSLASGLYSGALDRAFWRKGVVLSNFLMVINIKSTHGAIGDGINDILVIVVIVSHRNRYNHLREVWADPLVAPTPAFPWRVGL